MRGPIRGRREFLGATGAAVLGAAFLGSSSAQAIQSDETWSAYRNGATRSGYAPSTAGIRDGLEVEWSARTARPALAVVGGETVYARGESLRALTPDGEEKWRKQPSSGGWQDIVAHDDGVYVTSTGTVSAFDADGQRRWESSIDHQNPFLAHQNGQLFVSATDNLGPTESSTGTVYAIDPATGDVESVTTVPRLGWYVSASSERLFVTQFIGDGAQPGIRALDPTTGEEDWTWRASEEPAFLLPPAVGNGLCYVSTRESLVAVDVASGREVWREQFGQRPSPPVLTPEALYTVVDRNLVALDLSTSDTLWQQETGGRLAIGVGDTLYTAGGEGVFAHDRDTGDVVVEFPELSAQGIIPVDDRLLVSGDDRLYALGSSSVQSGGSGSVREISVGPGGELVFDPEELRIERGETVSWVWESDNHLITPREKPPESSWQGNGELEDTGYVHEHTFDVEGVYEYVCVPHEGVGMEGVIVVGDVEDGDGSAGEEDANDGASGDGSGTNDEPDGSDADAGDESNDDGSDAEDESDTPTDESSEEATAGDNESFADAFGDVNESDAESADGTPGPGILGALGGLGATAGWLARKTERENDPEE